MAHRHAKRNEQDELKSAMWEIRPQRTRKFGQFTRDWYFQCDRAFCEAMEAELYGTRIPRRGPNRNHEWTDYEIETLRRMWREGAIIRDIAEHLSLTKGMISSKARILKLPGRQARTRCRPEMAEAA